jgi:hypothetical protein
MYPPSSQLSSPNVCPVLKPSNNVLIAFTVLEHDEPLAATRIDTPPAAAVSLHSTTTFPNPHVDAISLSSFDTSLHLLLEVPPNKRFDPAICAHSTPLYAVLVMVVVAVIDTVDVAVLVTVLMSQLLCNTPF